ncbi:hypothetical protein IWX47DRAFT_881871 [Phyllosticta citricarpa]
MFLSLLVRSFLWHETRCCTVQIVCPTVTCILTGTLDFSSRQQTKLSFQSLLLHGQPKREPFIQSTMTPEDSPARPTDRPPDPIMHKTRRQPWSVGPLLLIATGQESLCT